MIEEKHTCENCDHRFIGFTLNVLDDGEKAELSMMDDCYICGELAEVNHILVYTGNYKDWWCPKWTPKVPASDDDE